MANRIRLGLTVPKRMTPSPGSVKAWRQMARPATMPWVVKIEAGSGSQPWRRDIQPWIAAFMARSSPK